MTRTNEDLEIVRGSGNVYEDLGYPDAKARLVKDLLAIEIVKFLRVRKLSNKAAQDLTGVNHTEFSRIKKPDLKRFTIDRLMTILNKLDPEIDIKVEFKSGSKRRSAMQKAVAL